MGTKGNMIDTLTLDIDSHSSQINKLDSTIYEKEEIIKRNIEKNNMDLRYIEKLKEKCNKRNYRIEKTKSDLIIIQGERNGYKKRLDQLIESSNKIREEKNLPLLKSNGKYFDEKMDSDLLSKITGTRYRGKPITRSD